MSRNLNNKPPNTDFYQSKMTGAHQKKFTDCSLYLFFAIGLILIFHGYQIKHSSTFLNQTPIAQDQKFEEGDTKQIDFAVALPIAGDVYFYLKIDNFYQNMNLYMKSKSQKQLSGIQQTEEQLASDCLNMVTILDMRRQLEITAETNITSVNGTVLADSDIMYPCGAIAMTQYKMDSQTLQKLNLNIETNEYESEVVEWQKGNYNTLFGNEVSDQRWKNAHVNVPENKIWDDIQLFDLTDPNTVEWFKINTQGTKKVYAKLPGMEAGSQRLVISNTWDEARQDSKKHFQMQEENIYGGKNTTLHIFMTWAGVLLVLGCMMVYYKINVQRKN